MIFLKTHSKSSVLYSHIILLDLIFDLPSIINYLSEIVTLNVGDIIFTGTPGGVGVMEGKFLQEGDVVTTEIEGLGTLRNKCKRITNHSGIE